MQAFTNTTQDKPQAIASARHWRAENAFHAFGHYWDGEQGNVSGCMYHEYINDNQTAFDVKMFAGPVHGIPFALAGVIDDFFGGLDSSEAYNDKAANWAETVYEAIPTGADLSVVPDILALYILEHAAWLGAYIEDEDAPLIEELKDIFLSKIAGNGYSVRMKNFYYNRIYGMKKFIWNSHKIRTSKAGNFARSAIRAIARVDYDAGSSWHYFLTSAVNGSAMAKRTSSIRRWDDLSEIFLQMLRDA